MSVLKEANATGRFWIGASDLEKVGHFKWFYNGNTISAAQWAQQGKPTDSEEALELDQVSIPLPSHSATGWSICSTKE